MSNTDPPPRAHRLAWPRLVGEFFVIVFGVLVALAADAWNDRRLDRIDEADYLARLHSAIASDTANFRFILDWMDRKETGLRRLDALLSLPGSEFSPDTVLIDLTAAANFGWNVGPLVGTATFEDLRSSGRIGLIRDSGLRSQIIEYYETAEGEDRRMQARRTEYPHISYQLVPFARDFEPGSSTDDEFASSDDVEALLGRIRDSELPRHILAETNRAHFVRGSVSELRQDAFELLDSIEAALLAGG